MPRLDLGEEWTRLTGLPFVYAFWAGPRGRGERGRGAAAAAGARRGPRVARRDRGAATAGGDSGRAARYEAYLRENIVYGSASAERRGCASSIAAPTPSALVPGVPELRFHGQA